MSIAKSVVVHVEADHIHRLASVGGKPLSAILELIWNALDADASKVEVIFQTNALGGLNSIQISDNGLGIDPTRVEEFFGNLGGSWKQTAKKTPDGRTLHGSLGKGRFKAFGLGGRVEWSTRHQAKGEIVKFVVVGDGSNLKAFDVTTPEPITSSTGTDVIIENMLKNWDSLTAAGAVQEVAEEIAAYLESYPTIEVRYNKQRVDPAAAQTHRDTYDIGPVSTQDGDISAKLTVVEWRTSTNRRLYLCDADGCTLNEVPPGIQAPGYHFSAYLKSDYVRELEQKNQLAVAELHPSFSTVLDEAKQKLRDHFTERDLEQSADILQGWKDEDVYPYLGISSNPIEDAERKVFNIVALKIDEKLPEFSQRDSRNRKLTFRLLRQALEESPDALARILNEVLDLPAAERDQFAALLDRTSLSGIINASKVVSDRLTFLLALKQLVFEKDITKVLKERTQLHRILAAETWVFGDEYHLMIDDQGLTLVLQEVMKEQGLDIDIHPPIKTYTGGPGIVDLMLGRVKQHWGGSSREYLVVELKSPSVKITPDVILQAHRYALALAEHPMFVSTDTTWKFWALSTEMDPAAVSMVSQKDRPFGLFHEDKNGRCQVWAMDWGMLIRNAENRYQFYQNQLELEVQADDATRYLQEAYKQYLPKVVLQKKTGP